MYVPKYYPVKLTKGYSISVALYQVGIPNLCVPIFAIITAYVLWQQQYSVEELQKAGVSESDKSFDFSVETIFIDCINKYHSL